MSSKKYIVHFPFLFLILTAVTGVWMRSFMTSDIVQIIPYDHFLHGHSHIAILGWLFLAVFIIFIKMNWEELARKKQAITIAFTTFILTMIMFVAFLYEGYAMYSIILSTAHIAIEYWVIIFIFFSLKTIKKLPKTGRLYIYGALIMLFVSSLGPLSLGAIASMGHRESPVFDMAIYFYLHFQYNGWLYLFLIGLFIYLLHKKEILLQTNIVMFSFWIYFLSLFPGYFLSVLWFDTGLFGFIFATIGAIGQSIGVLLFLIALFQARKELLKAFSTHVSRSFLFVFALLIGKSLMEFALLYPPFAYIIYDTRAVVIGYLHLTLLGFITIFVFNMLQSIHLLDEAKSSVKNGIAIFISGFIVNELALFSSGLFTWLDMTPFRYQNELLILSSLILLLGIALIWSSLFRTGKNDRT